MARGVFGPIIIGTVLMGAGALSACRHGGHERWRDAECGKAAAATAAQASAPVTSPAPIGPVAPVAPSTSESAPSAPEGEADE